MSLDHEYIPKVGNLQAMLKLEGDYNEALGLLVRLWELAAKHAPDGAVGRFSNEQIKRFLGRPSPYEGPSHDADFLIITLVETGWLAVCPKHRLVIVDWPHAFPWQEKK